MSRKPSDTFTRFTANSPHAAQNPSFQAQSIPSNRVTSSQIGRNAQPSPDGETPAQKVARLRAAARAQKEAQLSMTDRILARGRIWADNFHRLSAYGLIALTGVSVVVGGYSLISLIAHNRRQKRAWVEREMDRLVEAQKAFLRGEADAEQLHLLEQERAGEEIVAKHKEDKEEKKRLGIWGRIKGTFGSGFGAGDKGRETDADIAAEIIRKNRKGILIREPNVLEEEVRPVAVKESSIAGVGYDAQGRPVPMTKMERVSKSSRERPATEDHVPPQPIAKLGPLDVMAQNIANAGSTQSSGGGWFSWGKGSP